MRVAMVHNIIPPYRVPLLAAIARDPRIDLRVLFMAKTEANRSWKVPEDLDFPHEFLPGRHFVVRNGAHTLHWNPGVVAALGRFDPDAVVLCGYDSLTTFLAAAFVHRGRRRRVAFWSETNAVGKPEHEGLRGLPKRWIIRRADCALVPGKRAREYVQRFARPGLPFEIFPNIVESSRFHFDAGRRARLRAAGRARLGLDGRVILFSGQMIERKGFPELLAAFEKADFRRPATLVVMGTGALEDQARALAARSTPTRRVLVLPFQQIDAIPEIYASCDVLVLPSREDPWPLVVVEAMFTGLPVLVSDAVGNGPDLVIEGRTGWTFATRNENALAAALAAAVERDLEEAGRAAQAWAAEYCSVDRAVESFVRAVDAGSRS